MITIAHNFQYHNQITNTIARNQENTISNIKLE